MKKHLYEGKSATKISCGLLKQKYPAVLLHYLTRNYGLYFFLMLLALSKALKH